MTPGAWIFLACVGGLGMLYALRQVMAVRSRRLLGRPAPPLGGADLPRTHLVWFHAAHCGPCRAMRAEVDALADRARLIDVTDHPELASAYGVVATPTSVIVVDGTIAEVWVGFRSRANLAAALDAQPPAAPAPVLPSR